VVAVVAVDRLLHRHGGVDPGAEAGEHGHEAVAEVLDLRTAGADDRLPQ
jgi:hypothetical protein